MSYETTLQAIGAQLDTYLNDHNTYLEFGMSIDGADARYFIQLPIGNGKTYDFETGDAITQFLGDVNQSKDPNSAASARMAKEQLQKERAKIDAQIAAADAALADVAVIAVP